MRLFMVATAEMLESGEIPPGDLLFAALAPRCVAIGLKAYAGAAESAATCARRAEEDAAAPGGEAMAEAMRRQAASSAALAARAEEYAVSVANLEMKSTAGTASSSEVAAAARPATTRPRRPNARYFGPDTSARNGPTDHHQAAKREPTKQQRGCVS
ncbi:hypothetical protein HU200_052238 [Digitaria exilis]|uniref:Uncharacterized protein n=1 Tax=Digitaria exilis TaxID=1010633 RepID=A0A835E8T3_9POAL|nr:hypothetical protein HU200_052238 [Digitaria exilis]